MSLTGTHKLDNPLLIRHDEDDGGMAYQRMNTVGI